MLVITLLTFIFIATRAAPIESVVPRMLSLGVRLDGRRICLSRTDGGRWVDGLPALAARPGRGARSGNGQDRLAFQASRERPRVWVAVGSAAGFPGCSAVCRCFSGLWTAPAPLSRGPCFACLPPFPVAADPSPAGTTARAPFCCRTEPASPHVGVVHRPPLAGGVPGRSSTLSPRKRVTG